MYNNYNDDQSDVLEEEANLSQHIQESSSLSIDRPIESFEISPTDDTTKTVDITEPFKNQTLFISLAFDIDHEFCNPSSAIPKMSIITMNDP